MRDLRWMLGIAAVTFLFLWKITLTHQFSILVWPEPANQAYSWYHFSAASVQQGVIPLWDPYTHAGRTFVGGMETGVFYPPKLLLYLWPFSRSGLFSPYAFHYFYVLTHILAACFLFLLARELGLAAFPAFVASLCFSLAGFVSRIGWPDMLDSAIWLPLILLFVLRALNSARRDRAILYSCIAGLMLGTAVLGGRIHIVIMDGIALVSVAAYVTWRGFRNAETLPLRKSLWTRSFSVVLIVVAVGLTFGAVQLLPSIEYGPLAIRAIGNLSAVRGNQKIYYSDLQGEMWPRALMAFLFVSPFPGGDIASERFNPYFGTLPLMLVIIGVWRNWQNIWVRYLAGLAVAAFFYSLGVNSFLHGLLYSTVPYLWIAREPGRFLYLTHFSMAILAGFGVQTLFDKEGPAGKALAGFVRVISWFAVVVAISLGIPALYGRPPIDEWQYVSLLFIIASVALLAYISRGHATSAVAFVMVVVILSDHYEAYWSIRNIGKAIQSGEDYLDTTLLKSQTLADFLKSQRGLFRVNLDMNEAPNIGDLYGIQITECMMATELFDYGKFRVNAPRAYDMLNTRFTVRRKDASQPNPVYEDALWKVYENKSFCPRAWIVRETAYARSLDEAIQQMRLPDFDPLRRAIVADTLESTLDPGQIAQDEITIDSYQAQRIELTTRAASAGLLVLSEVDYPGWVATVNGHPTTIHKVNGLLRGIIVPAGMSKVVFHYAPRSIQLGAFFTCFALLFTLGSGLFVWRRQRNSQRAR